MAGRRTSSRKMAAGGTPQKVSSCHTHTYMHYGHSIAYAVVLWYALMQYGVQCLGY